MISQYVSQYVRNISMNRNEALSKIATTPRGNERALLLLDDAFRNLVLSSGANVTIYEGDVCNGCTIKEMLNNVYIGLIQRKNKHGNFDGLGALGGLAERTNIDDFSNMTSHERRKLVGYKDDIILVDNIPTLVFDMDIIRKNNVMREMGEELGDLGITNITINPHNMVLIEMPKVKDDNYMINIWDGNGECFAITPYCHIYKDDSHIIDKIIKKSDEQEYGEVSEYKKIPLFEALKAYGNTGNKLCSLEDGRDGKKDYRYPHEYLCAWGLATRLLKHDEEKIIRLASELQSETNHLISFKKIALATKQSMDDVAKILGVSLDTLNKMEKNCQNIFINQANNRAFYNTDTFSY